MSKTLCIIPARMGSSRYPGKPMAPIHGMPMIGHIYKRCVLSELVDETYVATCDQVIFDYIQSIGGKAVMTDICHERCTDRTLEALYAVEKETGKRFDIILMVQGDEPMVLPEMLTQSLAPMQADPSIPVVNLMGTIHSRKEHDDPNCVKVVVGLTNDALYFSREPIPSWKKGGKSVPMNKQVCVIPFRRAALEEYSSWPQTPLEIVESVDMMRFLENGVPVRMIPTQFNTYPVDTPEDLKFVEEQIKTDSLMKSYLK